MLHRLKKIVVCISSILVFLLLFALIVYGFARFTYGTVYSTMESTLTVAKDKLVKEEFENKTDETLNLIIKNKMEYFLQKLSDSPVNEGEMTDEAYLDLLQTTFPGTDFFLMKDGELLSRGTVSPLTLSSEELKTLEEEGVYKAKLADESNSDQSKYEFFDISRGKMILRFNDKVQDIRNSTLTGISDEYNILLVDAKSKEILYADDAVMAGNIFDPSDLKNVPLSLDEDKNIDINLENIRKGIYLDATGRELYVTCIEYNGYYICEYCQVKDITERIINPLIIPFILIFALAVILLLYYFNAIKNTEGNEEVSTKSKRKKRHLFYVNKTILSHSLALLITIFIAIVLFFNYTVYMLIYTGQNSVAKERLRLLNDNLIATYDDSLDTENEVRLTLNGLANGISEILNKYSETDKRDLIKEICSRTNVNDITLYDKNGVAEFSTDGYVGYQLTKNEQDAMFEVWQILQSDKNIIYKEVDSESHEFVLAQKRKDEAGILSIRFDGAWINEVRERFSPEEAVRGTDFGTSLLYYIKAEWADTVYYIMPHSQNVTILDGLLPEEILKNNYAGLNVIQEQKFYINTIKNDFMTIISALPIASVRENLLWYNLFILGFLLLVGVIIFFGSICKRNPEDLYEENLEEIDITEADPEDGVTSHRKFNLDGLRVDKHYRIATIWIMWVLVISFILLLLFSSGKIESLLTHVFSGGWTKGLNIFSVTASIIIICVTIIAITLIRKAIGLILKNAGPKGMTVGKLIESVIQFLGWCFILGSVLYQLGVNITAIFAGAGIVGVIIGIAAKDIFSDLIAGLFIIFEGRVRVGDWIQIKDWRGEVIEIGARTTVIRLYSRSLIINNSELRNFRNLTCNGNSAVIVNMTVSPDEDIERIKAIIKDNGELYLEQITKISEPPRLLGVKEANANGITIAVVAFTHESNVFSVQRKLVALTYSLLRENGIRLGRDSYEMMVIEKDSTDQAI